MTKVKINFKSGKSINIKCENVIVSRKSDNTITKIEWEGLIAPVKILYLHLDSIEAVIQL